MAETSTTNADAPFLRVRISPELKREIEQAAKRREISASALTRLALRAYIEDRKEGAQ